LRIQKSREPPTQPKVAEIEAEVNDALGRYSVARNDKRNKQINAADTAIKRNQNHAEQPGTEGDYLAVNVTARKILGAKDTRNTAMDQKTVMGVSASNVSLPPHHPPA
jgi:hypothetical protein